MYLRVTIIDDEKIGHRRVLIYSTGVLKCKCPMRVTRVCSRGTRLQISHLKPAWHVWLHNTCECLVRVNSLEQIARDFEYKEKYCILLGKILTKESPVTIIVHGNMRT